MTIGVVGLGYVGLPLAVAFAEAGHDVVGVDVDSRVTQGLAAPLAHDDGPTTPWAHRDECSHLPPTRAGKVDANVCRSPRRSPRTASRSAPLIATGTALEGVRRGPLVVLESNTIGYHAASASNPCRGSGGRCRDILCFSPERIDPGRTDSSAHPAQIVGGLTDQCRNRAVELYAQVCDEIVPVTTPEAAELTKLLENVFRSVNIALVNELAILCDRMDIDVWEVVEAAATKPYGFMSFKPGPGMGGPAFLDRSTSLRARVRHEDGVIELAKVNQACPTSGWSASPGPSTTTPSQCAVRG